MPECFWLVDRKGQAIQEIHLMQTTRKDETPGGTMCQVFIGFCAKEQQSWSFHSDHLHPRTGYSDAAQKLNIPFCQKCLQTKEINLRTQISELTTDLQWILQKLQDQTK